MSLGTLEELNELRECRRCAVQYSEINNLGTWRCHYHPGAVNNVWNDGTRGRWDCCGAPDVADPLRRHADSGCVKCDHVWNVVGSEQETRFIVDAHAARVTVGEHRLVGAPGVTPLPKVHRYVIRRAADDKVPLPRALEP